MRKAKWAAWMAGIAMAISFGGEATGQELGSGRVVITPGDMVSAGFGRAQAAVRDPFAVTPITETAESMAAFDAPADPDDSQSVEDASDLVADAIRQLSVNAISQVLAIFANDFLTGIGFPALFPTDFLEDGPDLAGLAEIVAADQIAGEESGDTQVIDDGTGGADTSGGRGGRNEGRPRG